MLGLRICLACRRLFRPWSHGERLAPYCNASGMFDAGLSCRRKENRHDLTCRRCWRVRVFRQTLEEKKCRQ